MKLRTDAIYQRQSQKKKHLLSLKNEYFAIIYKGCLNGDTVRKIHKALFDATINKKSVYQDKYLLGFAIKLTNKMKKVNVSSSGGLDLLAVALVDALIKDHSNDKAKKIINYDTESAAEKEKDAEIRDFIDESRKNGEWFYLASSHGDCAEDHKPYQGRLYCDEKAPDDVLQYAKSRNLYTVQWVMGKPAWFVTRPHCRHYFVSLKLNEVRGKNLKRLTRKYRTYTKKGDYDFQTPAKRAVEEYTDRLNALRYLYDVYKTPKLKNEILKTQMLLKKWRNLL
jgi:hypothetical protein